MGVVCGRLTLIHYCARTVSSSPSSQALLAISEGQACPWVVKQHVYHINHQGGKCRSPAPCQISVQIRSAMYLPGKQNHMADFIRNLHQDTGAFRVVNNIWNIFSRGGLLHLRGINLGLLGWDDQSSRPDGFLYAFGGRTPLLNSCVASVRHTIMNPRSPTTCFLY